MRGLTEKYIRRLISEELTRSDVRSAIENYMKEREFKKTVRNIAVDVLDDFFHEMWRKKGFWKSSIKD